MEISNIIVHIVFYVFSSILLISSAMVVMSRNPVKSILFMVLAFVATSGLWLLLEAEFLALILIIVYVGAVMTLFLFVVMMLNVEQVEAVKTHWKRYVPLAVVVIFMMVLMLSLVVGPEYFGLHHAASPQATHVEVNNIEQLGMHLYTYDRVPFILSAVILLVAMVAAIGLAHREPQSRKSQSVAAQIRVKSEDRIRIVKMKSSNQEGHL